MSSRTLRSRRRLHKWNSLVSTLFMRLLRPTGLPPKIWARPLLGAAVAVAA